MLSIEKKEKRNILPSTHIGKSRKFHCDSLFFDNLVVNDTPNYKSLQYHLHACAYSFTSTLLFGRKIVWSPGRRTWSQETLHLGLEHRACEAGNVYLDAKCICTFAEVAASLLITGGFNQAS